MKIQLLWHMTSLVLVNIYRCFVEAYWLHLQSSENHYFWTSLVTDMLSSKIEKAH